MAVTNLTDDKFKQEVLQSSQLVVVDFWAPWCGPCKTIAPILDKIDQEYNGKLKVCKINIDDSQGVTTKYQILSIPTLLFFKDGKVASQLVGIRPVNEIRKTIDTLLSGR